MVQYAPGISQEQTLSQMPEQLKVISRFNTGNRDTKKPERWCPKCDRRYTVVPRQRTSPDVVKEEQFRSGICSEDCFLKLTGNPLFLEVLEERGNKYRPEDAKLTLSQVPEGECLMSPGVVPCAACGADLGNGAPKAGAKCSKCRAVRYCNSECQRKAWKTHKKQCPVLAIKNGDGVVMAVQINSAGMIKGACGRAPFEQLRLSRSDVETKVLANVDAARGSCPIATRLGVPIVVKKLKPPKALKRKEDFKNQTTTYLLASDETGFAPAAWQAWIGPVAVCRADGGDLTVDDAECLAEEVDRLVQLWSVGPLDPVTHLPVGPQQDLKPETLAAAVASWRRAHPQARMLL